jgi:glycosyltransferase involved in cell wall biosynthesis
MRLLRIIPSIDPRSGGPAEAARRMDAALAAQGHAVEVATLDAPGSDFGADYPARVHHLGTVRGGYGYSPAMVPWLKANRRRFDAAVVDGLWQYAGRAAWLALAGTGTPYFVFPHGMLDPWFKRAYPLKHVKKWLYWPWGEYRVLRDASAVLFTCEEERRLARESFWLYRAREEVTAFGTADVPPPEPRLARAFHEAHPGLDGKRILLFLGRIQEKKGGDLLIRAFADVRKRDPSLHLVMAGPPENRFRAMLDQLVNELGLSDAVTWTGMLTGDLKWGAFQACEIFCLPSHQENFGIAVAEAMACQRPVAISDKVNIWREIAQDHAGWVGSDSLEGTRQTLNAWLDASPEEVVEVGRAARRSFERRFQIDAAAAHFSAIVAGHVQGLQPAMAGPMGTAR